MYDSLDFFIWYSLEDEALGAKIIIPPFLRHFTDDAKISVDGATIGECLDEFLKRFPSAREILLDKHEKLQVYVEVYLNGISIYPEELLKPVGDADEIFIALLIAGG